MQARSHAYRRPSTASGRLSSAAAATYHRPSPPRALAANRSEYWGIHGSVDNNNISQGFNHHHDDQNNSRRPQGGRGFRRGERPSSAGCYPTSSPCNQPATNGSTTTSITVKACTRNRAGIVSVGGRNGRATPPPTPPSLDSSPSSHVATTPPAGLQHRQQQPTPVAEALYSPKSTPHIPTHELPRRRPSTAGAKRIPSADDHVECGRYHYQYNDEPTKRVPVESPPTMPSGFGRDDRTKREFYVKDDGGLYSVLVEDDRDVGQAKRPAAAALSRPPTAGAGAIVIPTSTNYAPSNANQGTIYRQSSRSETRTTGVASRRRRPASAAPPRSRTNNAYNEHLNGSGDDNGGVVDADWRKETTRGRTAVSGGGRGVQRPRSASASTGRRAHMYGVDDAEQVCDGRRSFGASMPVSAGAVRSSPSGGGGRRSGVVALARPQSASAAPPVVVPSFVVSEKQVLRFFGHLTEGETFVLPSPCHELPERPHSPISLRSLSHRHHWGPLASPPPALRYSSKTCNNSLELDWGAAASPTKNMGGGSSSPILKIRQVVLHLYLADGSLEIFEKRQVLLTDWIV